MRFLNLVAEGASEYVGFAGIRRISGVRSHNHNMFCHIYIHWWLEWEGVFLEV